VAALRSGIARIDSARVQVDVRETALGDVDADLVCVGLFDDAELPDPIAGAPGAGDVKSAYRKLAIVHPERLPRALVVGLGKLEDFVPERARVAAALALRRSAEIEARRLAWVVPEAGDPTATAAALAEGSILASYRFDRYKDSEDDDAPASRVETLTLIGDERSGDAVATAMVAAGAQNRARELQDLPANVATPSFLAQRAEEIAASASSLSVEVLGLEEIEALGMGGLRAVSRGSAEEPRLIVLRHAGGDGGPGLGLVGKGVTFDSGGISIKPAARMHEMKMDMSGAAAVLEATGALGRLEVPLSVTTVVPATENMPSGTALKPGDVVTQYNGKTVEVRDTDAEGRLILADALSFCAEQDVDRIVDLATLTGAVVIALGSTYAALISNDDELADAVSDAGEATGELAWRLPLHPEYKELVKGGVADLVNVSEKRKAGTIYAGSFLEEFVAGKPWAHLDIAGTAWDVGREYVGKGASGFGVRLLVELARDLAG
jgi:leucyl aminopeptidase